MINRDDNDGLDDVAEQELHEELTYKMRTTGGVIAYRTAVAICNDPKATAAAKASAVNSLFRAGGFFAAQDPGGAGKELADMTADELRAASNKAKAYLANLSQLRGDPDMAERAGGLFD